VPKVKYGKGDVIWLNKLLATWEANGVLVREEREDEHRKVRVWFTSPERKRADPKVEDEDRASATEDMFNG
jgi:N-acetylglutamate synthase-like GNAT family acetyltransferase